MDWNSGTAAIQVLCCACYHGTVYSYSISQGNTMRVKCPHCRYYGAVRDSEEISEITGMAIYRCGNDDYGHIYEVGFEVIATISPSATPNPAVRLPIRKRLCNCQRPPRQTKKTKS